MKNVLALLPLLFALSVGGAQAAPTGWFAKLQEEVSGEYALSGQAVTARLFSGEMRLMRFKVPAGGELMYAGACDDDCEDLDLALFAADGRMLDRDESEDSFPAVFAEGLRPGSEVTAVVTMYDCLNEEDGCEYTLGLFVPRK